MREGIDRRTALGLLVGGGAAVLTACGTGDEKGSLQGTGPVSSGAGAPTTATSAGSATSGSETPTTAASATDVIARATVPVLCYHQVRPHTSEDSAYTKELLVIEPGPFGEQLDAIKGAGYTTITPDTYLAHLTGGAQLPDKPVILSFDDGKDNQPQTALPALLQRGMTGTWFIMTVVIGKDGWTSKQEIKQLADAGITIGCHTYDHHDVRKYAGKDFSTQFADARKTLQDISGQPVATFAYPYGAWNPAALPHLEKAGFTPGFKWADKPLDRERPLMTLRRGLAVSSWTGDQVVAKLQELSKPV